MKAKKQTRYDRMKRRMAAFHGEQTQLSSLVETLLGHLEAAIRPTITDADRIRYRCMIQDIRNELDVPRPVLRDRIVRT